MSYHIKTAGAHLGPFTEEQVQEGLDAGTFQINDRIFSKERGKWCTLAKAGFRPAEDRTPVSTKKRLVALLLCFFIGALGVHRFYVGKIGTGIVQVLTLGGFGIWVLIDFIWIGCGIFKDKDGCLVTDWV